MEDFIKLYQSMGMVANLIQIAIAVLTIVSLWMVFSKAGEGGWKIFIPIYNEYVKFKIAGCKGRYWVSLLLCIVSIGLGVYSAGGILNDLSLAGTLAYLPESII